MATVTELETKITELKEKLREVKGKRTEVYTRIVGYYRPVSNWNKGKYSEYQDRSEYSTNPNLEIVSEKKEETNTVEFIVNDKGEAKNYKLFYSDTCPSCPPVKNCLNQVKQRK